jgi:NADH:ubiquinone oxidoreductase subunit K
MNLTGSGIALRFGFALLLVLCTYNPGGWSYVHWIRDDFALTPYLVGAGLLLLIGWGVYLSATLNSLGFIGIVASAAVLGTLLWMLVYWGVLSTSNFTAMQWVIEILLAALLALGMCWSHFTRRMSGQLDVDELPE